MVAKLAPLLLAGVVGGATLLGCSSAATPTSAPAATLTSTAAPMPIAIPTSPTDTPTPTDMRTPNATPTPTSTRTPNAAPVLSPQDYVERGEYLVGSRAMHFHDPGRPFDEWNARHASEGYQAMLAEIDAAGERRIIATHVWYPVAPGDATRAATFDDFAQSRSAYFRNAYAQGMLGFLGGLADADGSPPNFSDRATLTAITAEARKRIVNSLHQAPIAPGRFPIIIAAHGLGGNSLMWARLAEYLASRGYVVVAPSFTADSGLPNVLESPDSRFAASAGREGIDRAYRTIMGEYKVIPNFYRYFFGDAPWGGNLEAIPGGGLRVGEMMAEFFTQRVDDVETIINALASLDKGGAACAAYYAERGQPIHGAEVCGLFGGALDAERVGVLGHSLGSMTAQFSVARLDRVRAAVGYSNGTPRYWEPPGIFGDGTAADGQPAGNPNPVMVIHGSEDAFVQSVFRGLMWSALIAAGGDPLEIWTLEQERVLPTDENPQPVARNAYNRATGDKAIILVKDVTHDSLTDDFSPLFSERNPVAVDGKRYWIAERPVARKAVGEDTLDPSFQGEPYTPLGWGEVGGYEVHLPTFIRNYYTRNWFDYHLKGDEGGLRFRESPVPEQGVLDIRIELPGR